MAMPENQRWRWFTPKTADCVTMDPQAYPLVPFDHWQVPWPAWACKAPDGGVHIDARLGRIDLHAAEPPNDHDELNWTCDFGVNIVSKGWFSALHDLVDEQSIFLGDLYVAGNRLEEWATLNAVHPPTLWAAEGRPKQCPTCGSIYTVLRGSLFFDPSVAERRLIVNSQGIFVRQDEYVRRNVRTPRGAFEPSRVKLSSASPPVVRERLSAPNEK
jgi:hypothetical protein